MISFQEGVTFQNGQSARIFCEISGMSWGRQHSVQRTSAVSLYTSYGMGKSLSGPTKLGSTKKELSSHSVEAWAIEVCSYGMNRQDISFSLTREAVCLAA